jgi:hypothetical protein
MTLLWYKYWHTNIKIRRSAEKEADPDESVIVGRYELGDRV